MSKLPRSANNHNNNHIRLLLPQTQLEAAAIGGVVMAITDDERLVRLARLRPDFFEELSTRDRTKPSPLKSAFMKMVELQDAGLLTRQHLEAEILNGAFKKPIVDAGLLDQMFQGAGEANFNAYARDLTRYWKQREIHRIEYRREQGKISVEQALREIALIESTGEEATPEPFTGFYNGFAELEQACVELPEEILKGSPRGQVVELVAVPDGGKSTLMLNVGLMLAMGKPFLPLAPVVPQPRRVLYLDCESTTAEFKQDVVQMLTAFNEDDRRLTMLNFHPVVEATIRGDLLTLSDRDHMRFVSEYAHQLEADFMLIDTVSSAFEIMNENDNAEVRNRIMRPLRKLAMQQNASVWFLHHDSKAVETYGQEASYTGRGASAFGALSRAVFTLKKEPSLGDGYVTLRQAKGKGNKLGEHTLYIDPATRWASISDQKPARQGTPLSVLLAAISDGEEVSRDMITERVEYSEATITRALADAVNAGHLRKLKHGFYAKCSK